MFLLTSAVATAAAMQGFVIGAGLAGAALTAGCMMRRRGR